MTGHSDSVTDGISVRLLGIYVQIIALVVCDEYLID